MREKERKIDRKRERDAKGVSGRRTKMMECGDVDNNGVSRLCGGPFF